MRKEAYEYNSLISLFKGVLLKMPTKIRISAMSCELCVRDYRCTVADTLERLPLNQTVKKKKVVYEFDHGPFKQFVHDTKLQNMGATKRY